MDTRKVVNMTDELFGDDPVKAPEGDPARVLEALQPCTAETVHAEGSASS